MIPQESDARQHHRTRWRKRPAIVSDVAPHRPKVPAIYRARYNDEWNFAEDKLYGLATDSDVNHGPVHAGTWLQEVAKDLAGRR